MLQKSQTYVPVSLIKVTAVTAAVVSSIGSSMAVGITAGDLTQYVPDTASILTAVGLVLASVATFKFTEIGALKIIRFFNMFKH